VKILALDAGLGPFSAALDIDGGVTSDRSRENDALENGLGRIAGLLGRANVSLAELDRIAVGIGPGTFTGIRIAVSFAKALAYGANVPLVGISSYDVLLAAAGADPCLTLVSGRPGVVCARLTCGTTVATACGPIAHTVADLLAGRPAGSPITVVANREDAFAEIGEIRPGETRLVWPPEREPAVVIARLARHREPVGSPHGIAPDYGEMPAVTRPKSERDWLRDGASKLGTNA
jgi:tRNA threonylcarbamoyladenosine biosynthesis protein TsaB